jgi:endonuclease III
VELFHLDLQHAWLKIPFNIPIGLKRIERAIEVYPKAMLYELAEMQFNSLFQQIVACIISVRTLDEVSRASALGLLKLAPTPEILAKLTENEIHFFIKPVTYSRQKAKTLKTLAQEIIEKHDGEIPCELDAISKLKGVSPQTANLALGIACGKPRIGVSTHVHRVTNRWGCVSGVSPAHTRLALEKLVPLQYWIDLNRLLVPFGKHICTWERPKCSTCPVSEMCAQVGVSEAQ